MHRRRMVELGRRYLGGHFRWTNLNFWRFEDGHVKHPHFYPTGKYSIKSAKCVMTITYGNQYFLMNFQIWQPAFKSIQQSVSISQTLRRNLRPSLRLVCAQLFNFKCTCMWLWILLNYIIWINHTQYWKWYLPHFHNNFPGQTLIQKLATF